jgi:4-amino-4-deoxy-L-arabinose transferase-like glycosyltransferase
MISAPKYRIATPLPLSLLLLLIAAYLLPGLIEHDPWKPDDAISFGIIFEALHGNWLVPTLAGEPYSEASPLYFWLAALLAKLLSGVVPLHGGARLMSAFCTALAIACTGLAAGELFGAAAAGSAALILVGSLGLLLYAHSMSAEIALFAALAVVFLGVALAVRRPLLAGLLAGCGIGAAFLIHGLAPAVTAALFAAIAVFGRSAPHRRLRGFWLLLLASALPWFAVWPALLYFNAPQQLADWWHAANLAQLPGWPDDGMKTLAQAGSYLKLLGWFAWPALPLALWSLWHNRRRLEQPGVGIAVLGFVLLLLMLSFGTDARDITALPLLLPLALLGAASVGELRRGAANALDWFGMMTFSLLGLLVWGLYIALQTGEFANLAHRVTIFEPLLEPGFVPHFRIIACSVAVIFSLAWIALIGLSIRSPYRGITNSAAGVTLIWGLTVALWLPSIDYGRSYRSMAESLKPHVVLDEGGCVSSRHLGEPQRAVLHYFAGLLTLREEVVAPDCTLMLVQGSPNDDSGNPGEGWDMVWQGNRPGDRSERYRLYRRLK